MRGAITRSPPARGGVAAERRGWWEESAWVTTPSASHPPLLEKEGSNNTFPSLPEEGSPLSGGGGGRIPRGQPPRRLRIHPSLKRRGAITRSPPARGVVAAERRGWWEAHGRLKCWTMYARTASGSSITWRFSNRRTDSPIDRRSCSRASSRPAARSLSCAAPSSSITSFSAGQ